MIKIMKHVNVKIFNDEKSVLNNTEILVQLNLPSKSLFEHFSQE